MYFCALCTLKALAGKQKWWQEERPVCKNSALGSLNITWWLWCHQSNESLGWCCRVWSLSHRNILLEVSRQPSVICDITPTTTVWREERGGVGDSIGLPTQACCLRGVFRRRIVNPWHVWCALLSVRTPIYGTQTPNFMFETPNFELETPNFEALNPKMSPEITNPNPQYWTPGRRSMRF